MLPYPFYRILREGKYLEFFFQPISLIEFHSLPPEQMAGLQMNHHCGFGQPQALKKTEKRE